ncbi:MAG: GyrI-like domain-containing protein [Bacteroidia bacterium]|nr:GyrI-like domain-containing protein [Bacteroidia bacterium]
MHPELINNPEIRLIGLKTTISLAQNRIAELWQNFMPQKQFISNPLSNDLYSVAEYPPHYFSAFNPNIEFHRWACLQVNNFDSIPPRMESLIIPAGKYAVFHYQGLSSDTSIFQYIYQEWLPASNYILRQSPHFEVLGNQYKNNDPNSKESIWIPIQER